MPAIAQGPGKRVIRAKELIEPTSSSRKILTFFRELIVEARSTSRFLQMEKQYQQLNSSLETHTNLTDNWDSYGAEKPSTSSLNAAAGFLRKLRNESFMPDRIIPSAEGGVAIYFNRDTKTAYVEYRNSGDVILAMYDDRSDPLILELTNTDADEHRALHLIRHYIRS